MKQETNMGSRRLSADEMQIISVVGLLSGEGPASKEDILSSAESDMTSYSVRYNLSRLYEKGYLCCNSDRYEYSLSNKGLGYYTVLTLYPHLKRLE